MNSRLALTVRVVPAGLVASLGLLCGTFLEDRAAGQGIKDGEEALKAKNRKEVPKLRKDLFVGKEPADPMNMAHVEAIDVLAKLVTYKYAWGEYLSVPGKILSVFDELESALGTLGSAKNRPNNPVATRMFCQQVIVRGQEVLKEELAREKPRPITLINTTRALARLVDRGPAQNEKDWVEEVLPRLAGNNAEQLADVFIGLMKAPKTNDGVRYYALRGMAGLLAVPKQDPDILKDGRDKIAREVLAFTEELNKRKFPVAGSQMVKEGFKALRREAVRVIAHYPSPFLGNKELPALFLAQIAGNDKRLNYEPRLDERLEASIGLARMQVTGPLAAGYNPDYAAEIIGRFIRDFTTKATTESEVKKAFARTRPWKVDAARLNDALKVMRTQVKSDYVNSVVTQASPILALMEKSAIAANAAANFGEWLSTNKSPTARLYRDRADSAIEERGKAMPDD